LRIVFLKKKWVRNLCHKEKIKIWRVRKNLLRINKVLKKNHRRGENIIHLIRICKGAISNKKRIRVNLFNWRIAKDFINIPLNSISPSLRISLLIFIPLCLRQLILDISLIILQLVTLIVMIPKESDRK
jgi:hypothetical protein